MKNNFSFNVKRKRPEEIYEKVSDYYKGNVLTQYARSKSMMRIQEKITIRALEILDLKSKNKLILDAGCGSGFSSFYLIAIGYRVVALDILSEFLNFYDNRQINPVVADMCMPPFKSNSFDGIISISTIQWIFRDINDKKMKKNLRSLALNFFHILKPGSKAVFQFYPKNNFIMDYIGKIFVESTSFTGNFIIDNPSRPKKRRIFLLLTKEKNLNK